MSAPASICGVAIEDLAEWSDPQPGPDGRLMRTARPSRLYHVIAARVPDRLTAAGIRLEWHGSGGARSAVLVQVLDAPPTVRTDEPVRVEVDASAVAIDTTGLLEWQPRPVQTLVLFWKRGERAFLDASDTGTGKTYVALAFARELRRAVACVTRKPARLQWVEAAGQLGVSCTATNYEALKTNRHPWVRWKWHKSKDPKAAPVWWPEWTLNPARAFLVFDEAQWCGSPDRSLNSKLLLAAAWRGIPLLMTSATLATTPVRMRAAGYALRLHDDRDFPGWMAQHGCVQVGGEWLFNNSREVMRSIHRNIFNRCAVRVKKAECRGFPECVTEAVLADFPAATKALAPIAAMLERIQARTDAYADGRFTASMAARQHAEGAKVAAIVEQARQDVEEGKAVALFFNFKEAVRTAAELLGWPVIDGDTPDDEREAIRRAFCADEIPGLILNTDTGGVALSLHGKRERRGHIMPTWKADTLKQVLGRLHRAGGSFVHYTIWFAAGTIEEDICKAVRVKLRNLDTLNDGDVQGLFALVRMASKTRKRKEVNTP